VNWNAKTELGREVAEGKVTSFDEVIKSGRKILEPQIIDALLPALDDMVVEITSTQRMTASGRKMLMRAVVVIGDKNGHVGYGIGKGVETKTAIASAIQNAKRNIVSVVFGCGSWECGCGKNHSLPRRVKGKSGDTEIVLMPAPRGTGLVAGEVSKKVLLLAGFKDVWSKSKGRTRNVLNLVRATINALDSLNQLKGELKNVSVS
jgi:small subunit ribosomal protein S5